MIAFVFVAAALMGPAIRYARLLYNMSCVPAWGREYLAPKKSSLWIARVGFVAPLLVVLAQV